MKVTCGYEEETGTYYAYVFANRVELAYANSSKSSLQALQRLVRLLYAKQNKLFRIVVGKPRLAASSSNIVDEKQLVKIAYSIAKRLQRAYDEIIKCVARVD